MSRAPLMVTRNGVVVYDEAPDLVALVREYQEARQMTGVGADERRGLACRALAAYPLPPNRLEPDTPKRLETDLKPCPFCGKVPVPEPSGINNDGLLIECANDKCGVQPHTSWAPPQAALAAWNRRAK